jgi:ABC-type Zn uptake system ZnuABC Zn-binding protein ZnuA
MRYLLLSLPLLLAACSGGGPRQLAPGETMRVMATTPAIASLAVAIAGEDAHVELLAPEGAGSHDYEPSVADRQRLESSHILLVNGLGLENFDAAKIAKSARVTLVDCSAAIPEKWLIEPEEEEHGEHGHDDHSHGHDHGEHNPHVWLCTEGAIYQAGAIADAFAAFDMGHADGYRKRFETVKARLEALADEYKPKIAALSRRKFVSNHDAFPYFAREFGLTQVGVIQRTPGHNPTVEQRREIEKMLKQGGAHAIFMEPGYDDAASRTIAANSGLKLATLDPFEIGKVAPDALESALRKNLETVLKTLE